MTGTAVAAAIGMSGSDALADTAATIETYASGTGVTYDGGGVNYPIVTAILSAPHGTVYNPGATLDGYTYNNWSYLAADASGSLDLFYSSTLSEPYTTPTVGDTIAVQSLSAGPGGNYSPFDGIPEIGNSAANPLTIQGPGSSGNSPYNPVPALTTIPTINVGTNAFAINSSGLAGTLIQLNNVGISANGATLFPTHSNATWLITDASGNSMTLFFWASSYSTDGAMGGTPLPGGTVDMTGFVDDFGNTAEFVPMSITVVPEPATLALAGLGGLSVLFLRRRSA